MPDFARLHPLLVHLPIGILLLGVLFDALCRRSKWSYLTPAVPLVFRIGAAGAVLSCLSGWLLADQGVYDETTLFRHRWLGIATAGASLAAGFLPARMFWSAITAILLILAGHFGGSLTHGPDYLLQQETPIMPQWPASLQANTLAYKELIAPVLETRCVSCHGPAKQKGDLRLDAPEWWSKGGKNGPVLVPGDASQSKLLQRCLLPLDDESHMPPRQRPQPTALELKLLEWWINAGADLHKTLGELNAPQALMRSLTEKSIPGAVTPVAPENPPPAATEWLAQLNAAGVSVRPLAAGSNWLQISFYNCPQPHDSIFLLLEKIGRQTFSLQLSGCTLPNNAWQHVGSLNYLRQLNLAHSNITDADLSQLGRLAQLEKLNLSHTQISTEALSAVQGWPQLQQLYLYQTPAAQGNPAALYARFPAGVVDTGGYYLPVLPDDTLRLK